MKSITRYGAHGDPLHEGKLDLPELCEAPTPDELKWAKDFMAHRDWREAVTYRETAPHEYTVRGWEDETQANEDFNRFTSSIRRFGYADYFYRLRHIYWVVDIFKYWTMGWSVEETTVINRAPVDSPEPWKADRLS